MVMTQQEVRWGGPWTEQVVTPSRMSLSRWGRRPAPATSLSPLPATARQEALEPAIRSAVEMSRRARSRLARLLLLEALLEALLECQEDLECQGDQGCLEDQGCQEADTAIQDVFASICPATWGLEALGCPQCHQRAPDLDLVPQDLLPLVAMEQGGRILSGEASPTPWLSAMMAPELLIMTATTWPTQRRCTST